MFKLKNIVLGVIFFDAFAAGSSAYAMTADLKNTDSNTTVNTFRYDAEVFSSPIPVVKSKLERASFPLDFLKSNDVLMIEYIPGSKKTKHISSYGNTEESWQLIRYENKIKNVLGRAFSCLDQSGNMSRNVVCFKAYPDFGVTEPIFIDLSNIEEPQIIQGPEEIMRANLLSPARIRS